MLKSTSKYFLTTSKVLKKNKIKNVSTMNFFCFQDGTCLSGINYLKKIIKLERKKGKLIGVNFISREDGDIVNAHDPVLIIVGEYNRFAYLENIIDGILSRMSSVSTNCANYKNAANDKEIIFMADRNDFYKNQPLDGYSAYIGGLRSFVTKSQIKLIKDKDVNYIGTMPHSLIQQFNGDVVKSIEGFIKVFPNEKIIVLIDYHNNCLEEIQKIANSEFKNKIFAVRIDTSKSLVDESLKKLPNKNEELNGVNHQLIVNVRKKLDELKMEDVKIIATSGIDIEKINKFNKLKTPVDIYGIGSSLIKNTVHFAGDLIKINDKYESKFGRTKNIEKEVATLKKW